MAYKGFPSVDAYVAFMVFDQIRTEGDVTTYEVVDRLDPRQLENRIIYPPAGERGTEEGALALRDNLRRQYATRLELAVR